MALLKILVTGVFIKVHLDDKDRKPSTKINTLENDANYCLGQQIFTPTPFVKELNMSSQYAIAFDHCPKFGMFEITTCLFCSHVIVSRATFLSA